MTLLYAALVFSQEQQKRPLRAVAGFQKNLGQITDQNGVPNPEVLYLLNTPGLNVQLRKIGFSYDVYESKESGKKKEDILKKPFSKLSPVEAPVTTKWLFHRIDVEFLNPNPNVQLVEEDSSPAYTNYYNVPGKEEGITQVTAFKKVTYKEIYPGIDVEFFIPRDLSKPVEYNFILRPGSLITDIKLKFSGAGVCLQDNTLEWITRHGKMKEIIPASWLGTGKSKTSVEVNFVQLEDGVFGFRTPNAQESAQKTLTIDPTPVREWATYFGGSESEGYMAGDVASDPNGNSVIVGYSESLNNIATTGRPETVFENQRTGYVARFDPSGQLLWSTWYGGNYGAIFYKVTIDKSGNIIGVGLTQSANNIATPNAHQQNLFQLDENNYWDGFIVKFKPDGTRTWGTYFGGESFDQLIAVTTDSQGNIFTAGSSASNQNISTPGSYREAGNAEVHSYWPAILAKFSPGGERLWATYHQGEDINDLGTDSRGNVYFVGSTYSSEGIATAGAHDEVFEYSTAYRPDAFVSKFSSTGERLWGTYFGGGDRDYGEGLVVDSGDNVIIAGYTESETSIATEGAHQESIGGNYADSDAFLAKFDSEGNILWSTYYGGTGGEGWGFARTRVDNQDNIFLYGSTSSTNNISTTGAFQETPNNTDVFLAKFEQGGQRIWGTYYGGNAPDYSLGFSVTPAGEIFLTGWTYSDNGISTPGAHQNVFGGKDDAFLVKFKDCLSSFTTSVPTGACDGEDLVFSASGATGYLWSGPNGFTSTLANPVIKNATAANSGTYYLSLGSGDGCDDTRSFEIVVSPAPAAFPLSDLSDCEAGFNTGISDGFDLESIKTQVLGNQTGMGVEFFDGNGNKLQEDLSHPFVNTIPYRETITVRVANANNPECFAETSFDLIVHPVPQAFSIANITTCDSDSDGIAETDLTELTQQLKENNSDLAISYFDMDGDPVVLSSNGTFTNSVPFRERLSARATVNSTGCYTEAFFDVLIGPAPVAYSLQDLVGCDDAGDGFSEFFDTSGIEAAVIGDQSGIEVSYFDEAGNSLASPLPNPYTNKIANLERIKIRLTNPQTGCFAETSLLLKTSSAPQLSTPATQYTCDEGSGSGSFDTSTWEQQIIGNQTGLNIIWYDSHRNILPSPLPSIYHNTVPYHEFLTARVEDEMNPLCVSEIELELVVNQKPELELLNSYSICGMQPSLELKMDDLFDTWEWRSENGSIISTGPTVLLKEEGNYSLSVGTYENGILCEEIRSFKLLRSALPEIKEVKFRDWSSHNYIEIIATGDADFEYSLDGLNFTDSNYFDNVRGGAYTVYARDKNGCGMASREVMLIDYPKFFTPNNDGQNDYWQLLGFADQPEIFIPIFDRYGKLLAQLSSHSPGWDGTYNGNPMPADDYWFSVTLETGQVYKTHFSLLR